MATAAREDQALDGPGGANAEALARPAPVALRTRKGAGREPTGTFRESEAERLALLKKENLECRLQRTKIEERQKKQQQEMAEAYKRHHEEALATQREERQTRLASLHARSQEQLSRRLQKSTDDDCFGDEEYKILLAKYGDKVRVPRMPRNLKQASIMASTETACSLPSTRNTRMPNSKYQKQVARSPAGPSKKEDHKKVDAEAQPVKTPHAEVQLCLA
jgi:hypothetical protein